MLKRQLFLLFGGIIILLGLGICFFPTALRTVLSIIMGIMLLISGASLLFTAITKPSLPFSIGFFIMGIVNILLGILIFISLGSSLLQRIFAIIMGIWTLIRGILLVVQGINGQKNQEKYAEIKIGFGAFALLISILMFVSPTEWATFVTILFGISMIVEGISLCNFALILKNSLVVVQITDGTQTLEIPQTIGTSPTITETGTENITIPSPTLPQ